MHTHGSEKFEKVTAKTPNHVTYAIDVPGAIQRSGPNVLDHLKGHHGIGLTAPKF